MPQRSRVEAQLSRSALTSWMVSGSDDEKTEVIGKRTLRSVFERDVSHLSGRHQRYDCRQQDLEWSCQPGGVDRGKSLWARARDGLKSTSSQRVLAVIRKRGSLRLGLLRLGLAVGTQSLDFNALLVGGESGALRLLSQQSGDGRIVQLRDAVTGSADQKLPGVLLFRCFAANEGIQGVDPMDQAGPQ